MVRFLIEDDTRHQMIVAAVQRIFARGETICFTPQVARESWSVLTRPTGVGGYAVSPAKAAALIGVAHKTFRYIADSPAIYDEWRLIVNDYSVSGTKTHDAYHVAAMLTHGITRVLTLDRRDFGRYLVIEVVFPENA